MCTVIGQRDVAAVLISAKVAAAPEQSAPRVTAALRASGSASMLAAGDHQRNARFIDQDGIRFIDHRGA